MANVHVSRTGPGRTDGTRTLSSAMGAAVASVVFASSAFAQYGVGFVWNRTTNFTPRPASDAGTSNGNPDGDSTGRPCWGFESTANVSGAGGLDSAFPWYTLPTTPLVWDSNWIGFGVGLWARGNDVYPAISSTYLQHHIGVAGGQPLGQFVPVVRWSYPGLAGGCPVSVRIAGNLLLEWSGNSLATNTDPIELAIVARRADGAFEPLFTGRYARPNTGTTRTVPVNVTVTGVSPGDAVLLTQRSTVWNGQNWNYLYDNQLSYSVTQTPSLIRAQPTPVYSCSGGSASFSVVAASAGGPFTYQWRRNGTPINAALNATASTPTLLLSNLNFLEAGQYDCVVTSGCGSSTSASAQLFIDPADIGTFGGFPGHDGLHNNNDFIAFINYFFNFDLNADVGRQGGLLGADGVFDNNDFIAFINQFFAGC